VIELSSKVKQYWQEACDIIKTMVNEDTFSRWIAGIIPLRMTEESFVLAVPNEMFCDWLRMNYQDLLESAIEEVCRKSLEVKFETGHEDLDFRKDAEQKEITSNNIQAHKSRQSRPVQNTNTKLRLNRRYTFDNFVVGEDNKFAHAASNAVAKAPGMAYNPLFLYGKTGLGKTHLLQAIADELLKNKKNAKIEYISSEEFSNTYIEALQGRKLSQFRNHYRNIDLLLIDDVHFFNGKERLQEEFFHTFNALYNSHKQIVLTSDRPPHDIGGLEKRLVSRFEWGLTTDINPPDLETRIAILRKKQETQSIKLSDEVIHFIAERICSNIRSLEGALIRLISFASVTGFHITVEKAEQLLHSLFAEEVSSSISIDKIQRAVAEHYDIRIADMTSKRRPRNIAEPRQIAMFLSRKLTEFSSPVVAECFNRNHATILHACTTVKKKIENNGNFKREINMLERKILH